MCRSHWSSKTRRKTKYIPYSLEYVKSTGEKQKANVFELFIHQRARMHHQKAFGCFPPSEYTM